MGLLGMSGKKEKKPRPVLCVDDDADVLSMLVDAMQMMGMRAIGASNGPDAVKFAQSENPRLILLDMRMPGMDGLQTLPLLHNNPKTAHIPVVMVTGETTGKNIEDAFSLGAKGYVIKPIRIQLLIKKVKEFSLPE